MVVVKNLVKNYPGVRALRGVTFDVDKGEIVGLLGPNGAGKSTTMRIITSYVTPTSGEVSVSGCCVMRESLEVRRKIGYMPEHVPLYKEMRVDEFLAFRARLKGVRARRIRARLDHVISLCQIADVARRVIGTLSKGYQQRVGLADAVVHDPDLLILDEPTIGLDPGQVRQFRETIRSLSPRHTVILSSHILSEVEAVCSRVLILRKGKIEASDTPENLKKKAACGSSVHVEAQAPPEDLAAALKQLCGVEDVETAVLENSWCRAVIFEERGSDLREPIGRLLLERNWVVREIHRKQATLEDVFVEITHEDRA